VSSDEGTLPSLSDSLPSTSYPDRVFASDFPLLLDQGPIDSLAALR
jgi:hypothetical protein